MGLLSQLREKRVYLDTNVFIYAVDPTDQRKQEIAAILVQRTDEEQRLRQNSTFAGALAPREVWAIKERRRRATSTA